MISTLPVVPFSERLHHLPTVPRWPPALNTWAVEETFKIQTLVLHDNKLLLGEGPVQGILVGDFQSGNSRPFWLL
jgi:hypothetical protein